jgi:hypothetical protein
MAQVIYDGNKIEPSPFLAVTKSYNRQNGVVVGSVYTITMTAQVFADKGSPRTDGWYTGGGDAPTESFTTDDAKFNAISDKLNIIDQLFRTNSEGKVLQWQDEASGGVPTKANVRIVSTDIPQSREAWKWVDIADYTIVFEADDLTRLGSPNETFELDGDNLEYLQSLTESFSLEEQKEGDVSHFVLTRQVSAVGKDHYDTGGNLVKPAWERAQDACVLRLANINRHSDFNTQDLTALTGYEETNSEVLDEAGGTATLTQIKIFCSQNYIQSTTINANIRGASTNVEVSTEIRGLGDTIAARTAASNAAYSVSALHTLAQVYSTTTLNSDPASETVGRNLATGILTANVVFDDRPTNFFSDALTESISLTYTSPGQLVAQQTILGRATKLLQDLSTGEARTASLSIDAVFPRPTELAFSAAPDTTSVPATFAPTGSQVFEQPATKTWNQHGRAKLPDFLDI